ncbi:MAG: hypothetical protein LBB76_12465 [Azoarcus sp.]|jgi:hypothetical protein|nr:hypothetical protein [Azoarcus sp.]
MKTDYMIDTPEFSTPVEECEAFLEKMKTLPQDDEGVQFAIRRAEFVLKYHRGELDELLND